MQYPGAIPVFELTVPNIIYSVIRQLKPFVPYTLPFESSPKM